MRTFSDLAVGQSFMIARHGKESAVYVRTAPNFLGGILTPIEGWNAAVIIAGELYKAGELVFIQSYERIWLMKLVATDGGNGNG